MSPTSYSRTMALLKILFGLISVYMIYLVIDTSLKSNMFQLPEMVLKEPWFTTTLVDFYFNIFILSCWVIYKEKTLLAAGVWIVAFVCLGSIATAFYVFLQFSRLKKGDPLEKVLLRNT